MASGRSKLRVAVRALVKARGRPGVVGGGEPCPRLNRKKPAIAAGSGAVALIMRSQYPARAALPPSSP